MNKETFAALKELMDNLEGEANNNEADNNIAAVKEIKQKCLEALNLIEDLRFKNNSPHVQLATKQSTQYINKALFEIEAYFAAYDPVSKSSTVSIKDIFSPVHAGLEIILNLDY
jgi:hypothetical protein